MLDKMTLVMVISIMVLSGAVGVMEGVVSEEWFKVIGSVGWFCAAYWTWGKVTK